MGSRIRAGAPRLSLGMVGLILLTACQPGVEGSPEWVFELELLEAYGKAGVATDEPTPDIFGTPISVAPIQGPYTVIPSPARASNVALLGDSLVLQQYDLQPGVEGAADLDDTRRRETDARANGAFEEQGV